MGGLNLPLVSIQYKRLQVVKQSQLLTSADHCTRQIAERSLQRDLTLKRAKFQPSVVVRDMMVGNPDFNRVSLSKGAKLVVQEEACEERHEQLLRHEREGQMFRCTSSDAAGIWSRVLMDLSDEHRKFAINSAVDTLPHNANLHLWRKRNDDVCPLCGDRQTLIHVLNICPVAYKLGATISVTMQCSGRLLPLSQAICYQQRHSLQTSPTTSFPITLFQHH